MKRRAITTGLRVAASFAVVLLIMAGMTAISLWRQYDAENAMARIVNETLASQRLTAELLAAIRINGVRALAIARSDSMELSDYFKAQLNDGERDQARIETALEGMPRNEHEQDLRTALANQASTVRALRTQIFTFKDQGRTAEVETLVTQRLQPALAAYAGGAEAALQYQSAEARRLQNVTSAQFAKSRHMVLAVGFAAALISGLLAYFLTRSIVLPLRRAVSLTEHVASGHLSTVAETVRSDEIGSLFQAQHRMTRQLASIVALVQSSSSAVDTAAREIAAGNLDLSARTERQAGALVETAASMEELSVVVQTNHQRARHVSGLAEAASSVATQGGLLVAQVIHTMETISAYGKQIAEINNVIDGIAFQTNILALNAAVEAARAGEEGRGFAVVAGEVRALAQRSAGAARKIKSLINDSTREIASGAALAQSAGTTMDDIVTRIAGVTAGLSAMTAASASQESSILEVNAAIGDMDHVTQQNAALVEQAAAAAVAMQEQAAQLAASMAYFKLDVISRSLQ